VVELLVVFYYVCLVRRTNYGIVSVLSSQKIMSVWMPVVILVQGLVIGLIHMNIVKGVQYLIVNLLNLVILSSTIL